jgi:hypothetical protein
MKSALVTDATAGGRPSGDRRRDGRGAFRRATDSMADANNERERPSQVVHHRDCERLPHLNWASERDLTRHVHHAQSG